MAKPGQVPLIPVTKFNISATGIALGIDYTFSNSLITHQVKTKKTITMKDIWIPGLS